jgi:hypothetical protein
MTPDARDLASLNTLRVLFPMLAGAPPVVEDDDMPDDVAGAIELHGRLCERFHRDQLASLTIHPATDALLTIQSSPYRLARLPGCDAVGGADHFCCRLNC